MSLASFVLRIIDSLADAFGLDQGEVDAWLLEEHPDVGAALDATRAARARAVLRVRGGR